MACVYPIDAWRAAEVNASGKRGIVFNPRSGFQDQPLQVPCGKCIGCRSDRARTWAVRMYHESTLHARNCFITLTYSDAPEALVKHDFQCFIKRLRHRYKVRYFGVGEYGSLTRRPHYHAIIFGEDFLGGSYAINDRLYSNGCLDSVWGRGICSVGRADIASMLYVGGYATKKLGDPDTFHIMSRKPPIGRGWVERYGDDIRRLGACIIDGSRFQVPPAYLTWGDFEAVKERRRKYVLALTPEAKWEKRTTLRGREVNYNAGIELKKEML